MACCGAQRTCVSVWQLFDGPNTACIYKLLRKNQVRMSLTLSIVRYTGSGKKDRQTRHCLCFGATSEEAQHHRYPGETKDSRSRSSRRPCTPQVHTYLLDEVLLVLSLYLEVLDLCT